MTPSPQDTPIPLPEIHRPDHTDHPVLAVILAEVHARDAEALVVAHYEDAP